MFERSELTGTPIVAFGTTYTPVARVWRIGVDGARHGFGAARARPRHVEVVAADGARSTIQIRDPARQVARTLVAVALLALLAGRPTRRRR